MQSCDLDTKVLGLNSSQDQFLKILVWRPSAEFLVSRPDILVSWQRSWLETKTWFRGKVMENIYMYLLTSLHTVHQLDHVYTLHRCIAVFHWARKCVTTTFPVGFYVPHKLDVVSTTRKLIQIHPHRVSNFWRKWQTPYE